QRGVVRHAPLEDDVRELRHPGELAGGDVVAALPVLDHVERGVETAYLVERGARDPVDLDGAAVVAVRVDPLAWCRHRLPPYDSVIWLPPCQIPMCTTMNSAG